MKTIDPSTVPDALSERDLEQIQALVFRGWARDFPYAGFLFVKLPRTYEPPDSKPDPGRARAWLRAVSADVAYMKGPTATTLPAGGDRTLPGRLQLAFTTRGLRALGLDEQVLKRFPDEAKAGMERRARVLGDRITLAETQKELIPDPENLILIEENKPMPTDWLDEERGGMDLRDCDAMIMLYGASRQDVIAIDDAQRKRLAEHGGTAIRTEMSGEWKEREPFGFADGLSQPAVKGQPARGGVAPSPNNEIAAGEILLGYRNQYGQVPKSPAFDVEPDDSAGFDVGKNGTFLVFRKLEQDVKGFWETFGKLARDWQGVAGIPSSIEEATHWLAARAMGRWTNGNSVLLRPDAPGEKMKPDEINEFAYGADAGGVKCPIASHVRRANPRDERGGDASDSWKVVMRHRILRRGRAYGDLPTIDQAMKGDVSEYPMGLLFVCLQSSIAKGFEFVQQIWNNNPGFHGIYQEPDPITGPGDSTFTIPHEPARLRTPPLPRFVIPRGGGYFFVPSRATIELLAG